MVTHKGVKITHICFNLQILMFKLIPDTIDLNG